MIDTGKARLPALPAVSSGNLALDGWMKAVAERLEVREGNRGNPYERVVTLRELNALGLDSTSLSTAGTSKGVSVGGVMVQTPSGTFTRIPIDAFSDELRKTRLYRDLNQAINDATRFDTLPEELRNLLLDSIADEATKRGADIQRLDKKVQSATESLAYTVQEVTAAVQGAQAGVREAAYAAANANHATAGKVTQIQARLDDVGGVTIEESMTATADRVAGLAGEYMVKINAGGAVASIGLAASEDPTGATHSSFGVQADTFFVAMPGHSDAIPFGVDSGGAYINGAFRINSGGDTLAGLAISAAAPTMNVIGDYASAPSTTGLLKNSVYKNTTNGNSYRLDANGGSWVLFLEKGAAGANGSNGANGADGTDGATGPRGTVNIAVSGYSSWNGSAATSAIATITGTSPMNGDIVTEYDSTHSFTYFWGGATWNSMTAYINGNMLVSGTLTVGTLTTDKAQIVPSAFYSGSCTVTAGVGTTTLSIPSGLGTPLYTVASAIPANCLVSHVCTYMDTTSITITTFVYNMSTNLPYTGSISTLQLATF